MQSDSTCTLDVTENPDNRVAYNKIELFIFAVVIAL